LACELEAVVEWDAYLISGWWLVAGMARAAAANSVRRYQLRRV